MNVLSLTWVLILTSTILAAQLGFGQHANTENLSLGQPVVSLSPTNQSALAFFDRIRALNGNVTRVVPSAATNQTAEEDNDVEDDEEEEDDDDDEEEEDGDDEEAGEEEEEEDEALTLDKTDGSKILSDIFGNKLKLESNRTVLVKNNKARDLGLIAIKAIILGPLIGLTLKAALIRGLIWALLAYFGHLFFPGVLSALGLGTGLVGFARQYQPTIAQMLLPALAEIPNNLHSSLPNSFRNLASQYRRVFVPVVDSIRSIPEGHCRFRAVCETASQLIRGSQFMSSTLQRLSATVYLNFGTEYSRAWLDGIVQTDCATKYSQCPISPLNMVASKIAETTAQ